MMSAALTLILACFPRASSAAEVQWGAVSSGELRSQLRVSGKIIPREGSLRIVSARVQGRITSIHQLEGGQVRAGDLLFSMSGPECFSLSEEKRVAQGQHIQELIDAAHRREEQLGLKVSDGSCDILAPYSGTLAKRYVELGAAFNLGDALATIVDIEQLTVELQIPERDLPLVRAQQSVRIKLPTDSQRVLVARVEHILPTIDPATRTVKVRLSDLPSLGGMPMDSLVFAEIDVRDNRPILKVSTSALVFQHNQQYVVKKDSATAALVPVPVEILNESDKISSIRPNDARSLRAGDVVAVKGAIFVFHRLQSGS